MSIIFQCVDTYAVSLPACPEGILVDIGLAADTNYSYVLRTPYGKRYEQSFTTLADGAFIINPTDFPVSLFNPWAGIFLLQIYQGDNCDPTIFTICEEPYTGIAIRFEASNTRIAKIGCTCAG